MAARRMNVQDLEKEEERMEAVFAQLRRIASFGDRVAAFLVMGEDVKKCRFKSCGLRTVDRLIDMATNDVDYVDMLAKVKPSRIVRAAA